MTSSEVAFAGEGKSTSMLGGAKYMCSDIIQIIMPKKSCKKMENSEKVLTVIANSTQNGKRNSSRAHLQSWLKIEEVDR